MTPELPRAPMSEPWPMARHTSDSADPDGHAVELGHHRLEREGHVRARVAIGHRIDIQAVDVHLVGPECVPIAAHHGAQLVCAQGRQGGHGKGC